jgi:hypothetical protein
MKYIKPYQIFESSSSASALTQEQIGWLDKCVEGSWKLNPLTGLVDVDGDFDCSEQGLTDLKGVKFGKVSSGFRCENNQLTSLVGAPQAVGVNFYCYDNQLTTLEGAPKTVGWHFNCDSNVLTSLEGAPQKVSGDFWCRENQLTTLVGAPQKVGGDFWCRDNPVSESTLKAIFALMKKGKSYQQALEERWPDMGDEDRVLMYKQMPDISPEDVRKYKALATYSNIKSYL